MLFRSRALEGLDDASAVLMGAVEGPVPVPMNGATYLADLTGGQKTGLFYDQRPNHAFAARLAPGARVLDVFSHVGGFALAALAMLAWAVLTLVERAFGATPDVLAHPAVDLVLLAVSLAHNTSISARWACPNAQKSGEPEEDAPPLPQPSNGCLALTGLPGQRPAARGCG